MRQRRVLSCILLPLTCTRKVPARKLFSLSGTHRLLRSSPLDDEIKVRSADALAMTRRLHRDFGLLVGTSSGANVFAALAVAGKLGPDPTVVTILCDRAERYFSTRLFGAGTLPSQG